MPRSCCWRQGALGELEGELRTAYRELRVQALPAALGADEGCSAWPRTPPPSCTATTTALTSSASCSSTTPKKSAVDCA
ncbi:hypothetical protein JRQ81_013864 [Phrynocephalus forsythii]|uniref:Uncharacterized protein n=1 Tax=Phrynocephalus forsythii TaxID=171643 RepID=A0A9Q0Y383_9SAUR|nr:hypothetical protein JRQ81_013864 [Phrynocephalus forsythii]